MFDTHILVFTHVPKCGGTSLCKDFKHIFGRERYYRVEGPTGRTPDKLSEAARDSVYVLTGHFRYVNPYVAQFKRKALHLATVRDPIDRIASYHSYFQAKATRNGKVAVKNDYVDFDLNEAVERMIRNNHEFTRNDQCHYLSGDGDFKSARRNIERNYLLVTTMRSLQRISNLINETFGDASEVQAMHANKSRSQRAALDPRLEETLRERTRDDARLFEWIAEREDENIEKAERQLSAIMDRFGVPDMSRSTRSRELRKRASRAEV